MSDECLCGKPAIATTYFPMEGIYSGVHQVTEPHRVCSYHAQKAESQGYVVDYDKPDTMYAFGESPQNIEYIGEPVTREELVAFRGKMRGVPQNSNQYKVLWKQYTDMVGRLKTD